MFLMSLFFFVGIFIQKAAAECLRDLGAFSRLSGRWGRWECQIEELSFTELESIHP